MVKTKRKGNQFELKIYKTLREKGEAKRCIGSGSSDESGDISFHPTTTGKSPTFAIECKHLKNITWHNIENFYWKLVEEIKQKKENKIPIVIFRENRGDIMAFFYWKNIFVMTTFETFLELSLYKGVDEWQP